MKLKDVGKAGSVINLEGHYNKTLNKNHYVGPYCRVYRCDAYRADDKGYCSKHSSPLRTGIQPGLADSSPVVITKPSKAE